MAMRTPPRTSVERELVRVTPTPGPRYRPSYIPLPTPLSTPSNNAVNVRASLQHRPSESGGSRSSGDDARTGRSSSLSARTSSPALASTGIPAPSRPSFNLGESTNGGNGHHQRSYSSGVGGMDHGRFSSLDAISDSGRNSALGGSVVDDVDDSERILPVKVAVRIRPLVVGSNGEQQQAAAAGGRGALTSCLEAVAGGTIAVSGSSSSVVGALADSGGSAAQRTFHYDYAFGPDASQSAVYEAAVFPLLQRFVEGYNVTVLAYGQTSSGKTYTMGTESDDGSGVVPRALRWLFAWWAGQEAGRRGSVRISFLEVYNDELIDLVAQTQGRGVRPPIFVREDAKGHVVWTGVKEVSVDDADVALGILADGSRERQTGGTRMNEKSSRSHAIYSVTLTQARGDSARIVSKLHFVDLAGSERLKKTLAVGERQREGIAINSGLLALGNVISALGDPHRGAPSFVPYRDSKLTHMLRDSLGGSAQTLLIACVSQAEANVAESLNTLKYAARARNIRNRGGVNMVATRTTSREVEALRAVVRRLKSEVSELNEKLLSTAAPSARDSVSSRLAFSPPGRSSTVDDTPSRIPTMGAALQRRALAAEETSVLRSRNQALEGELEQLNDTYTELLLKFNDACREIEDRQSEGFERDQRLRDREQEIRRLTAHSRRATATTADPTDSVRPKRRSLRVDSDAAGGEPAGGDHHLPQLPDLARLRLLRSETADRGGSGGGSEAPGAAEFDAILEECDANVRALEAELRSAHDALAALRLQLQMQDTRATHAEKLTASQVAQIDALRAQLAKARDAGVAEEERRRAADAELEDAALAYEAQLEAVASEWRQELHNVDEQWNDRWEAADAERTAHIEDVKRAADARAQALEAELASLREQLAAVRAEHDAELDGLRADYAHGVDELRAEHEQVLAVVRLSHEQECNGLRTSHEKECNGLRETLQKELSSLRTSHAQALTSLRSAHAQELATPVDIAPQQLLSPPPTAGDDAAGAGLYAELERSASSSRLEAETEKAARLEAEAEKAAQLEAEAERLRAQALEAEARASAAEAALAALTAKAAAAPKDDEPLPLQPLAVRALSSDLPRRTSDRIMLCARSSAEVTPSELRLRNVRHRYSTVAPAQQQPLAVQPQPDRFASYPELRLASSPREAPPSHAPPVYDEDHIQRMLRDAAAEVDEPFGDSAERRVLLAEVAQLKETKKDLQERNSQMKNLMRDLGDRLVGLAEENDQLEARANERDHLHAEVSRLTQALAKLEDAAADGSARRHSIDSFRSADSTNAVDELQTRLALAEADLAAAMVSVDEHQSHVTELLHDADGVRRRIADLEDDLAHTMRQLDDSREDSRRLEQLARAHADADAELKRHRTLVACLQESLVASEETAEEAKLASDRFANELVRVQAESRALAEQADELQRLLHDARAMVATEARDRDVWKGRCQDLREEVDELRVRRRQNKILCF